MIKNAIDFVKENPVKCVAIGVAGIATGGIAFAAAPAIAGTIGGLGLLGSASTGTAIGTLSGAALTNASLAAIGGGALATGGGGMAAGTAIVAATGTATGLGISSGIAAVIPE